MIKRWIIVRWEFEGFHSYPDAPNEVAFLKNHHRHLFKCSAKIEVAHNERDLEFFIVKSFLQNISKSECDDRSCESLAEMFINAIRSRFAQRSVSVEVSEDGENSGVVEYIL